MSISPNVALQLTPQISRYQKLIPILNEYNMSPWDSSSATAEAAMFSHAASLLPALLQYEQQRAAKHNVQSKRSSGNAVKQPRLDSYRHWLWRPPPRPWCLLCRGTLYHSGLLRLPLPLRLPSHRLKKKLFNLGRKDKRKNKFMTKYGLDLQTA